MSGIKDASVVDLVVKSKEGNAILAIVEEGKITDSEEVKDLFLKKINSYIEFYQTGQMAEMYPELAGKPLDIEVNSFFETDSATIIFFEKIEKILAEKGIGFKFKILSRVT